MQHHYFNTSFKIKENSFFAKIAANKLHSKKVAMVIGKTIHLHGASQDEFLQNTKWLKHELCHIKQFKKHGFLIFIVKYLWESIKVGYHQNKYEIEARLAEDQ